MNRQCARRTVVIVAGVLLLFLLPSLAWLRVLHHFVAGSRMPKSRLPVQVAGPDPAFVESYLAASNGRSSTRRTHCNACHSDSELAKHKSSFLISRGASSREAWANAIPLPAKCGVCHVMPDPSQLPRPSWPEVIGRMVQIMGTRGATKPTADERLDILHFYLTFSLETQPPLGADPDPRESPLRFEGRVLGNPASADSRDRPFLGHVQLADLDKDGRLDVLVCDSDKSAVTWIHNHDGVWREDPLATVPHPAHTQVLTGGSNGRLDIVVGCLGVMGPTDDPVGRVVVLSNQGGMKFAPLTILDHVARVADVEPGDFDNDGDTDLVVAEYGFINQGEVGWLEKTADQTYRYHRVVQKTGAINVLPVDLDGDGNLDFVALFAQEHEEISAFMNDGKGAFEGHILFKAATPAFGSSGIELIDLDQDGDEDILYTNGDNLDLPTIIPRPYHGVQWLENKGNLNFVWHDLHRCYGAYCAVAADLNNDGHLDIVVTTLFNDWTDLKRASLLWLENDGKEAFTPHSIATRPTHLISAAVGDLDGDGRLDIVTCGMYGFPPHDRMGRVTLWKNRGAR